MVWQREDITTHRLKDKSDRLKAVVLTFLRTIKISVLIGNSDAQTCINREQESTKTTKYTVLVTPVISTSRNSPPST